MMTDWQEEASVMAQECSTVSKGRLIKKQNKTKHTHTRIYNQHIHIYIYIQQTTNALMGNKHCGSSIMHLTIYSQLNFINTKDEIIYTLLFIYS